MKFTGYCRLSDLNSQRPEDLLSRCGLPEDLPDWCRRAERQFDRLDQFLEGHYG
jgi:hypothetical protein